MQGEVTACAKALWELEKSSREEVQGGPLPGEREEQREIRWGDGQQLDREGRGGPDGGGCRMLPIS